MPRESHQILDLPVVVETAIVATTVLTVNRSPPGPARFTSLRYRLALGPLELR
jgi:hypothetical protein